MAIMADKPSFELRVSTGINASAEEVYAVATDITRMGEWSPENTGGEWISGVPGAVGARFLGHNQAHGDSFSTECQVLTAEPGELFTWAVLTGTSGPDTSVWSFEITPAAEGVTLTQRYVMKRPPAKFQGFLDSAGPDKDSAVVEMRKGILRQAMEQTVAGIKKAAETR